MDVSAGELIDRITILELKREKLSRSASSRIESELNAACAELERALVRSERIADLKEQLRQVNRLLWDVEEALRGCERAGSFGERFVELARCVYKSNDRRAAIKRRIDECVGSEILEHKSYDLPDYRDGLHDAGDDVR